MYIVRKVTKKSDGSVLTEDLGFVDSTDQFNMFINTKYYIDKYAITIPDIKSYGSGSRAITVVDLKKMKCPIVDGSIFTIVSTKYNKLV